MEAAEPTTRRSWVEQIMGMPVSVLARGRGAASGAASEVVAAVFAELRAVDAMFSTYRPDSAVSLLNAGRLQLADCADDVRTVAQGCAQARELTGGLFDADRPDGGWDPSGYVKGWAVERAARHLGAVPEADWCLNAGGDVAVVCAGEGTFNVGIAEPQDQSRIATVVVAGSGGVATSGTAQRGAHLWDPRTGRPASPCWDSVTVVGPSLLTADVLATAAFVAGGDWERMVLAVPGYRALGIGREGTSTVGDWPT
ncbi:MAG: FAD:protein FMN transferase [Sporichthyaceae bacterium]